MLLRQSSFLLLSLTSKVTLFLLEAILILAAVLLLVGRP